MGRQRRLCKVVIFRWTLKDVKQFTKKRGGSVHEMDFKQEEQHEQTVSAGSLFMALNLGLQSTVSNPTVHIP